MVSQRIMKFATKDESMKFHLAFKMSTKYTAALMFVLMCISLGNQSMKVKINCRKYGFEAELSKFCWNQGTFLVAKALEPQMSGSVAYPGVYDYDRDNDELIKQNYYKRTWIIFAEMFLFNFLLYIAWEVTGKKRVELSAEVGGSGNSTEKDMRVRMYVQTVGQIDGFDWFYVLYKALATLSLLAQWFYANIVIGKRFAYYGVDLMNYYLDDAYVWPKPMDVLFPKVANCELEYQGDSEMKTAQCELPMNEVNQWLFAIYWYWLAVIFFLNLLSFPFVIFRNLRVSKYNEYVRARSHEEC